LPANAAGPHLTTLRVVVRPRRGQKVIRLPPPGEERRQARRGRVWGLERCKNSLAERSSEPKHTNPSRSPGSPGRSVASPHAFSGQPREAAKPCLRIEHAYDPRHN